LILKSRRRTNENYSKGNSHDLDFQLVGELNRDSFVEEQRK